MQPTSSPPLIQSLLSIRKYGDPVLRKKAALVERFDESLVKTTQALFRTMYEEPGIGLAAPQVGLSMRLMVVDISPEGKHQPIVLANPVLVEKRGRIKSEEGCLSFPGITVTVRRFAWVKLAALNERGFPITVEGEGLLGRCLQHELDHLNGVLMIDHLSVPARLKVMWEIRRLKASGNW